MRNRGRLPLRLVLLLRVGAAIGIAGWAGSAAASAQEGPEPRGEVLLGGAVRPGLPVALHAPARAAWRGEWGSAELEVTGNAAAFLWPEHGGAPLIHGAGAPPPGSFRPLPTSMAVVGLLPGAHAVGDAGARPAPVQRLREAVLRALKRPARFVRLERELEALAPPVLAALDLVVAGDRAELLRRAGVESWIRLGGQAVVLDGAPDQAGPLGLGRVHGPDPQGRWDALELNAAFAAIQPPRPAAPAPPDPQRAIPLLVVLVYLAAAWWTGRPRPASRRLRLGAAGLAAVVGVGIFLGPLPDTWSTRASRSIWCIPGTQAEPWRHVCYRISPRGKAPAALDRGGSGPVLFTRVPGGARIEAAAGRTHVSWSGDGWLSLVEARPAGPGIRLRRAGARTLLAARLPEGQALEPAYWIGPGEVRVLPRLESGTVCPLQEAPRATRERLPVSLADLMAAFPPPPTSGVVVGVLRGADLEGENLVYALPEPAGR